MVSAPWHRWHLQFRHQAPPLPNGTFETSNTGRAAVNLGTITSTKLRMFQCHTPVVANIKSEVGRKDDLSSHSSLPTAERDRRIVDRQKRLQGLCFRGDHSSHRTAPEEATQATQPGQRLTHCERKAQRSCVLRKNRARIGANPPSKSSSLGFDAWCPTRS